jgi:hypothetical protein
MTDARGDLPVRCRIEEIENRADAVEVADGERAPVRTERKCALGSGDRAAVAQLSGAPERGAELPQRPRIEDRDPAVVPADREQSTVGGERVVDDLRVGAMQDRECSRAAKQRCEQVAARRGRVVEANALAREQQRPVEPRLRERLRAEPLSNGRRRLSFRGTARSERDDAGNECSDEEEQRDCEQPAQAPRRARVRVSAFGQELPLDAVERRGLRPLERRRQARAAVQLSGIATRGRPLRRRLREVQMHAPTLYVLLEPRLQSRPMLEQRLVDQLDGRLVGDEQPP